MTTLVLSGDDTREIVRRVGLDGIMDELISRLTDSLLTFDSHRTVVPLRSGFHYQDPTQGLIEWMPVMQNGRATIKVVGYHPHNPTDYALPTILGSVSTYDARTGHLRGLADGTFLTALRTGAASAVATRLAAHEDASVIGLVGCGAQSVAQLHALSRVVSVKQVLTYDTVPSVMKSFPERVSSLGLHKLKVDISYPDQILEHADILCTATSVGVGKGPVFEDSGTKPWLHINAAGSDFEGKFELPVTLLLRSFVFPDVLEQAISQGECQQLEVDHIGPELHVLLKHSERYAHLRSHRTVFDSTGWALEDHVALDMMLDYAADMRLGTEIAIESISHDAKNPYEFIFSGVKTQATKSETDQADPEPGRSRPGVNRGDGTSLYQ